MSAPHVRVRRRLAVVALAAVLALGGCSQGDSPEVPEGANGQVDAVLAEGREVWSSTCAKCHGADGGGGSGVKLADGRAEELHPQVESMIEVVTEGKGAMPSFGGSLSDEEIEAVVRYVREVL
ncbi:MAG: cytochrome c [Acidimicrobiia bacterium]|nr:cytochrome c [Acidimicrobiia bacterium]